MRHQPIEKCTLSLEQLRTCLCHRKPADPIDLGEFPHRARALWPLQLESVAICVSDLEVALDGEGGDHLAAGLFQRTEVDSRAGRHRQPELLENLALCGRPRIVPVGVLALGNRPGPVVLAGPKRTTGMRYQD